MKRRILNFFAALITTVIGVNAQTLSVADTHMDAGWFGNITVNISGATEMTALQFNLALPEGVSLGDITKGEYIKPGEAANSHMYSVSNLPSGDLLIVVYNLNLKTFKDGVLMRIPVNTADDLGESAGRIYNVRTSTVDAVSHKCSEATFKVIPKVALTVDKASATLTTGETLRLNAEVWPTNLTVEWVSSDESVATVENGVVTAVAAGTATITAKAGDKEATCVVTVEAAAVEPEAKYYWYVGNEIPTADTYTSLGQSVTSLEEIPFPYITTTSLMPMVMFAPSECRVVAANSQDKTTSISDITAESNVPGYNCYKMTAASAGARIYIASPEKFITLSILVINETMSLAVNETGKIRAFAKSYGGSAPYDGTMTWTTSDAGVAIVDNEGLVTAISAGTATLTATANDGTGVSATCVVTVEAAAVEPEPEPEGLSTSKYYRVKNVSTSLYLQVEGNNTNMKLQNKAEGLAMMQIFGLEDAGEGMYYIKAADSDNRYYAHASGWDFNTTTNADNKTPFTIALVEGETSVYTLHQGVSDYPGLAGADDAAAGAAIYCNKSVDNNGKWTFEALTEEEDAAYVTTLTATAKAALDAAIARGEEVVATRSAVLTAEEVAAINGAVQAAKEGKDAATEVAALNALTDAINAAIDAAIYVWSIDELSNEVCYAVSTEDRGAWYSQTTNLTSTAKAGVATDATDKQQQFAFVQSPETGAYYLYSVSEEKFVKVEGQYTALTEAPVQTIAFLNGTRSAKFPWVVALNAEDGQKQMGISNGYDPAVITFYNDLGDGGNTVRIEKVATFDATEAIAAIKGLETGIESSLLEAQGSQLIYDLQGRRVEKAVKGVYIVNGKKVVIK